MVRMCRVVRCTGQDVQVGGRQGGDRGSRAEGRGRLNAGAMAFIGDAVWELRARDYFLQTPRRLADAQALVYKVAKAEFQRDALEGLVRGGKLKDKEVSIVQWGKNAQVNVPNRLKSKGKEGIMTYKSATAFECLLGHFHLEGQEERIDDIVDLILGEVDETHVIRAQ